MDTLVSGVPHLQNGKIIGAVTHGKMEPYEPGCLLFRTKPGSFSTDLMG